MHPFFVNKSCMLQAANKSLEHQAVQDHLQKLFGPDRLILEKPFPKAMRIADCLLLDPPLIFEIQCSPMSPQEALQRTHDYKSQGFTTIWILHDREFNRFRMSALERALRATPHYFTNISAKGKGMIYDQIALIRGGCRIKRGPCLEVDLRKPLLCTASEHSSRACWPIHFSGDAHHRGEFLAWKRALIPKKSKPIEERGALWRFLLGATSEPSSRKKEPE